MTSADAARLANMITVSRLLAAPVIAGLILYASSAPNDATTARVGALCLFIIAALSDFADGWIARRFNAVTSLGAGLDHAADKALTSAVLIALSATVWPTELAAAGMVLVVRDVAVAGLREGLASGGATLPVDGLGKIKTALLMVGLIAALLEAALIAWPKSGIADAAWLLAHLGIWGALVASLVSGVLYFRRAMA